jgi:hypothetical protein
VDGEARGLSEAVEGAKVGDGNGVGRQFAEELEIVFKAGPVPILDDARRAQNDGYPRSRARATTRR